MSKQLILGVVPDDGEIAKCELQRRLKTLLMFWRCAWILFFVRRNSQVRATEQAQNTADHLVRRLDPAFRASEQAADSLRRSIRRLDPSYRAGDQEVSTLQRALVRSPQNRLLERAQDRAGRATARSFGDRRVVEQAISTLARRSARIAARQAIRTIDAIQNIS